MTEEEKFAAWWLHTGIKKTSVEVTPEDAKLIWMTRAHLDAGANE